MTQLFISLTSGNDRIYVGTSFCVCKIILRKKSLLNFLKKIQLLDFILFSSLNKKSREFFVHNFSSSPILNAKKILIRILSMFPDHYFKNLSFLCCASRRRFKIKIHNNYSHNTAQLNK